MTFLRKCCRNALRGRRADRGHGSQVSRCGMLKRPLLHFSGSTKRVKQQPTAIKPNG
jgi:hypothetical protein